MCTTTTIFELEFPAVRVENLILGLVSHSDDFDLSDFSFRPTTVDILVRDEDEDSVETITTEALRVDVNGRNPWTKIGELVTHMRAADHVIDRFGGGWVTPNRIHHIATINEHFDGDR
ncbi:hypothetical protein SAMN05444374_1188 [Rhodococcoides kroppenstedtii]|uniref:Uncharacterized protein n=1 Tax=Rhodococcoides kroppenstedtii TaxID=293050 RepID=A0A1I0UC61_9NOCA|nr:hypothetical protein [Rhodococcus kroppenstedtii]SFA61500.1 hypothetical protein SAMN05444374_1188 [Rhodococcus kroppenstedtii]